MKFGITIVVAFLVLEINCFVVPEQEQSDVGEGSGLNNLQRMRRGCCKYYFVNWDNNFGYKDFVLQFVIQLTDVVVR